MRICRSVISDVPVLAVVTEEPQGEIQKILSLFAKVDSGRVNKVSFLT